MLTLDSEVLRKVCVLISEHVQERVALEILFQALNVHRSLLNAVVRHLHSFYLASLYQSSVCFSCENIAGIVV